MEEAVDPPRKRYKRERLGLVVGRETFRIEGCDLYQHLAGTDGTDRSGGAKRRLFVWSSGRIIIDKHKKASNGVALKRIPKGPKDRKRYPKFRQRESKVVDLGHVYACRRLFGPKPPQSHTQLQAQNKDCLPAL